MNTLKPIYNRLSIRQILANLPANISKTHRNEYIKNCLFVYKNEPKKFNLGFCKLTRDANFRIINFYLNP